MTPVRGESYSNRALRALRSARRPLTAVELATIVYGAATDVELGAIRVILSRLGNRGHVTRFDARWGPARKQSA